MTREQFLATLPEERVSRVARRSLILPCRDCDYPDCKGWGAFADRPDLGPDFDPWSAEEIAEARAFRDACRRKPVASSDPPALEATDN